MAYLGRQPLVGNYQVLDALTASATATYALTKNSVAVFPQTPANCIVSLNGVIQAPFDSYTISGSNIVFASALTGSDSIDFITVLGDVLNVGTVSDGTITPAKMDLSQNYTFTGAVSGQNYPAFLVYKTSNQDIAEATDTKVTWNSEAIDTDSAFASDKFTVPSGKAGKYFFSGSIQTSSVDQSEYQYGFWMIFKNGSRITQQMFDNRLNNLRDIPAVFNFLIDLAVSDYIEIFVSLGTSGSSQRIKGDASYIGTWFSGFRIGD